MALLIMLALAYLTIGVFEVPVKQAAYVVLLCLLALLVLIIAAFLTLVLLKLLRRMLGGK